MSHKRQAVRYTILLLGDGGPTLEEIWIEEPQRQGRLHPDPSTPGQPAQGVKGRRYPDTLPAAFQLLQLVCALVLAGTWP